MIQRFSPAIHAALLLLLCAVLYFPYVGTAPFFDKGEPREAMAVQDIVRRGEWLVPLKRATDVPSKPPLFHWSAAAAYHVTGRLDEATIRLPSALYATLGVVADLLSRAQIVQCRNRALRRRDTGDYVGLPRPSAGCAGRYDAVLFRNPQPRAVLFAVSRVSQPSDLVLLVFCCHGIGTLAKGPLGILLPALVAGVFVLAKRKLGPAREVLLPSRSYSDARARRRMVCSSR